MSLVAGRPTVLDNVFWWLLLDGIIAFNNIDVWADDEWHWKDSVNYSPFTERGAVLMNYFRNEVKGTD